MAHCIMRVHYDESSDKQGVLGSGNSTVVSEMMVGNHTITLTAKDRNGLVKNSSIDIQFRDSKIPLVGLGKFITNPNLPNRIGDVNLTNPNLPNRIGDVNH